MIRRALFLLLALCTFAAPAVAKDELVLGMTQTPGTWNPLISSMLAKSLISNMTARPLTAYDANSKLICLVCTELPTIENGKARVIDLPETASKGHGGRRRDARHEVGRRRARHRQGRRLHPGGRQASAVGRRLVGRLQAHPQARHQGRPPLHHDDRPRDVRLQQPRPQPGAGAYREADLRRQSGRVPQQDGLRHRFDQSRPRLRPLSHRRGRAGQPHRARAEYELDGREAALQAHRRQDHREYRRARGQPAVGQCRLRAGRARAVARPGAGLREAPQGQVRLHLQAGADLRAYRRHARQQRCWPTARCARRS